VSQFSPISALICSESDEDAGDMSKEERVQKVINEIRSFPDFPKPGVLFRDIFSLTKNPRVFADCISLLVEHIRETHSDVEVIAALDSRGFIFGVSIALQLNIPFVPLRKKGKLPGEILSMSYSLEYGKDELEMQKDAISPGTKVIIVDDLLATGGTMKAAMMLMREAKADVLEGVVVLELCDLKGREQINGFKVFSLIPLSD